MKAGRRRLKQKDFTLIKTLLNQKIQRSYIAEITNRSSNTISRIDLVDTFEQYQQELRAANMAYKAKRAQRVVQSTIADHTEPKEDAPQSKEEPSRGEPTPTGDELIHVLWMIEAQIRRLADAWEKKPTPSLKERILG